uniref:Uncharacterized protein n=1 Tax=candidate division CPR3 bacterium TaxID=2268181 RepID=A0A7V3N4P1_UNCC3
MKNHRPKVWLAVAFMAVAAFLVSPAWAGRWELKYTPNAAISLTMVGERIVGIVNPAFGPGRAGELELRLAGVPFLKLAAPPYEFGIDPTRPVTPLPGEEFRGFGAVTIREGLDYTIEAYVVEKGNRKQSAAPATTFRLEKQIVAPPGPPSIAVSEEQLKKLLKEAYDEGFARGQQSVLPHQPEPPPVQEPVVRSETENCKVLIRLWDEKGLPDSGKVLIRFRGGEQQLEVSGTAEIEVPAGTVSILIPKGSGWTLGEGQKPTAVAPAGTQIVWDLYKGGGSK